MIDLKLTPDQLRATRNDRASHRQVLDVLDRAVALAEAS